MFVKTESDMGCIKIYSDSLACFFDNDFGDSTNTIEIREKRSARTKGEFKETNKYKFLNHFTVREKPVYLSLYDCSDEPVYEFKKKGRYFVYLKKPLSFLIEYMDEDTHC
jgi:hypothetical protein